MRNIILVSFFFLIFGNSYSQNEAFLEPIEDQEVIKKKLKRIAKSHEESYFQIVFSNESSIQFEDFLLALSLNTTNPQITIKYTIDGKTGGHRALRDYGGAEDARLSLRHARVQAGPQRQGHARRSGALGEGEKRGPGGHQVPPVRAAVAFRERPHDKLHPAGRGLRPHDLPHQHAGEAPDLGRVQGGPALAEPHEVPGESPLAIQGAEHREQRGHHAAGARRRHVPAGAGLPGIGGVLSGGGGHGVDNQELPGGQAGDAEGRVLPALRVI